MAAGVEFSLLGPLEVRRDGVLLPLAAGRQRALLAALLLRAGQVVPSGDLIEVLWDSRPPPTAQAGLHNYVRRLREALADGQHEQVVTYPHGYLIRVGPGALDVTRFEALLGEARAAAQQGSWQSAAGRARAALALWRGEPLADTGSQVLTSREAPRLVELRLQAIEVAVDAGLRLGQPAGLIGELRGLVAEHPLRERLHALLMLALYRADRQGEALASYADARRVLVEELGAEPGPGLREMHQQILTADPVLGLVQPGQPASVGMATATRTLPRDIDSFTGRDGELARLAATAASGCGVVGIQAIGGMAGVGKTAFAVHAAHRLAPQFPDGQLFAPLHGHTPGHRPAEPADALASLLVTAGFAAAQIPPGLPERTGLWRDHLAGQRVLLLLDDAVSSEQVEPLLPGTGGSLVLVTSRRHLTGLAGAELVSLDVLPPAVAADLLVRLAGRSSLAAGDAAIAEICAQCGYLPLAIGMLGRQLHHHPAWTPAGLAADLTTATDRLELMATENTSVAAAFDLSYTDLTRDQKRLFRRLGLHTGSDFDAYAAAALDGCPLAAARRGLAALYDHCLLTEPAPGRYQLHDLLRQHAGILARREDPAGEQDRALDRLVGYYLHAASLAGAHLSRQPQSSTAPALAPSPAAAPGLPDGIRALAWARAERANMVACLDQATGVGQHGRVVALTDALAPLLTEDGPWAEAVTRHTSALHAARQSGDRPGQARALTNLGVARQLTGDRQGAAQALTAALGLCCDLGDPLGQANAHTNLGVVHRLTGDLEGAAGPLQVALDLYRELGDRLGQAGALLELGIMHRLSGDYGRAIQELAAARGIFHDLGNRGGEISAVNCLGAVRWQTGEYQDAAQSLEAALALSREIGDRLGQGNALLNLGAVRRLTGDYLRAAQSHEAALSIFRDLGNRSGQANALLDLGAVRRLTGDHQGAIQRLQTALGIYRDIGDRLGQANALLNLGIVSRLTGDHPGAAQALETALDIHRGIGDRIGETEALNEAGTLHRERGHLARAEACHQQALELARQTGDSYSTATALAGLGRCALAAGHPARATASLQQAHQIFQQIGAAETASVAAELAAAAK